METPIKSMEEWLVENVKSSKDNIEKEAFNDALSECRRLLDVERNNESKINDFLYSVLTSEYTSLYLRKQARALIKEGNLN